MRAVNLAVRVILSLGVSALFVWLSLRNADLRAVGRAIASASVPRMAAYAVVLVIIHLVRTVRWGILLEPLGHVGFKRLNSASAVGFMLLMLLPFRLGEFARPILIARPPQGTGVRLRRSGAMASIVVERLVDDRGHRAAPAEADARSLRRAGGEGRRGAGEHTPELQ